MLKAREHEQHDREEAQHRLAARVPDHLKGPAQGDVFPLAVIALAPVQKAAEGVRHVGGVAHLHQRRGEVGPADDAVQTAYDGAGLDGNGFRIATGTYAGYYFKSGSTVSFILRGGGEDFTTATYNDGTEHAIDPVGGTFSFTMPAVDGVTVSISRSLILADLADNSAAIAAAAATGLPFDVTLAGRKLYKDGYWNTICLPFGLFEDEITNSPLAGCTLMKLDGDASGLDSEGTLTLSFVETKDIEASLPYIIKWDKDDEHPTIDDPLFEEVLISKVLPNEVIFNGGKFIGQFCTFDITSENRTEIVLLGAENKIGYSAEPRSLHAFRAHFEIPDGEQNIKAYKLNFGDGSTTFIAAPDASAKDNHDWFDLSGRRLSGKPARTGIYIHNGQKVIVR